MADSQIRNPIGKPKRKPIPEHIRDLAVRVVRENQTACVIVYQLQTSVDIGALNYGHMEAILRYMVRNQWTGDHLQEILKAEFKGSILNLLADLVKRAHRGAKRKKLYAGQFN